MRALSIVVVGRQAFGRIRNVVAGGVELHVEDEAQL